MNNKKFSFLGAGNMAGAIIKGLGKKDICIYDKDSSKYNNFPESFIKKAQSAPEAVAYGNYIILAVKPQNFEELLCEIKASGVSLENKVFISIAAGISTDYICKNLEAEIPCVRTMPNTPLLIGKGVTALSRNSFVSDCDFEQVCAVFASVGHTMVLDEADMNTIISATSSAPAYVFLFIKSIYDSAKAQGLECDGLLEAVCKMVIGSAELMLSTGKTPDELIRMVTSPKGTTEQAMKVFEDESFSKTVDTAMRACTKRAEELSSAK